MTHQAECWDRGPSTWRQWGKKSLSSELSAALGEYLWVHRRVDRQAGLFLFYFFFSFWAGEQACHSMKTDSLLKSMKCHFFFVPIMARGYDSSSVLIWMQRFQQLFQQVRSAGSEQNLTHFSVAESIKVMAWCAYRQVPSS